jgi:hypothetical protein
MIESGKGKATVHEDTVLEDSISKGICQHSATRDYATANYHQPPIEGRTLENMTKDPISEYALLV